MRTPSRSLSAKWRIARFAAVLGAAALVSPASAAAETVQSSNWAGYVARDGEHGFQSVSASWTAPAATCSAGHETHSAVWVGLGGFKENATALEQIGTDADCTKSGRASYSSWVELLPAAARTLKLAVHPGDRLRASVTVIGRDATLRLRDLTTGARYSATRRLAHRDVSTADWIVEAPSGCDDAGRCHTLDLTDFGSVGFTAATATTTGQTATVGSWSTTELVLSQDGLAEQGNAARVQTLVTATPGAVSGGAFSVTYGESAGTRSPEAPTLPGLTGEPVEGAA